MEIETINLKFVLGSYNQTLSNLVLKQKNKSLSHVMKFLV